MACCSNHQHERLTQVRLLSPEGRSYAFDNRATSGYGRGEGVAVVVLKSRSQAEKDGDTIRAIVRASGMNQDGRTAGITMPNGKAQADLIRGVYAMSGLNPLQTGYVEAHGTGKSFSYAMSIANFLKARLLEIPLKLKQLQVSSVLEGLPTILCTWALSRAKSDISKAPAALLPSSRRSLSSSTEHFYQTPTSKYLTPRFRLTSGTLR